MSQKLKSYSLPELSNIGREIFNLPNNWHCFKADVVDTKLHFYLAEKDVNGCWIEPSHEYSSSVSIYEDIADDVCEHKEILICNKMGKEIETGGYEVDLVIDCASCNTELFRISEYKKQIHNYSKHKN